MLFFTPALIALMALGLMTTARPTFDPASHTGAHSPPMTLAEAQAMLAGFEQQLPGLEAAIQDASSLAGIATGLQSYKEAVTGRLIITLEGFEDFVTNVVLHL